jgi:hypothetical protein
MSDLWITASADTEAELAERLLAQARVASAGAWGFLASSVSRDDFENRIALVSQQLDAATEAAVGGNLAHFTATRVALHDSIVGDFEQLYTERQAEIQRVNNRRAAVRAEEAAARKRVAAVNRAFDTATVRKVAAGPDWLHERNNDPYGTPGNHEFWNGVDYEDIGEARIFERDGKWYLHHRRQNYWMTLNSRDEAVQSAGNQGLDMWASRRKASISLTNVGIEGDVGVGTDPSGKRVKFQLSAEDKKALSAVLYSDLSVNFSGVDVEIDDIIAEGTRKVAREEWSKTCERCGQVFTGTDYYNGWPSQDAWHHSLGHGNEDYIKSRQEAIDNGTFETGWAHADCDHAYGICMVGSRRHAAIDDPQSTFTLNPDDEKWIGNFTDDAINENIRFWSSEEGRNAQPYMPGYDAEMLRMFNEELNRRRTGSRRTASPEGWWPLTPSERWPGENALTCPQCGKQTVVISGSNLGSDVVRGTEFTSLECTSCGARDIFPKTRSAYDRTASRRPFGERTAVGSDGYRIKRAGQGEWVDLGDTTFQGAMEEAKSTLLDPAQSSTVLLVHNKFNDSVTVVVADALGNTDSVSSYEQFYGSPYTARRRSAGRTEDGWEDGEGSSASDMEEYYGDPGNGDYDEEWVADVEREVGERARADRREARGPSPARDDDELIDWNKKPKKGEEDLVDWSKQKKKPSKVDEYRDANGQFTNKAASFVGNLRTAAGFDRCPSCGSDDLTDIEPGKSRCDECGWGGTPVTRLSFLRTAAGRFEWTWPGTRKPDQMVVMPVSGIAADERIAQGARSICRFNITTGIGVANWKGSDSKYFMHLSPAMGAEAVTMPPEFIAMAMGVEYKPGDAIGGGVFMANRRTAGSPSDICPQCGAYMHNVVDYGNVLEAECDECGWRGSKRKASRRLAIDYTQSNEMMQSYPGLAEAVLFTSAEVGDFAIDIAFHPALGYSWVVSGLASGNVIAEGMESSLEAAKGAAEAKIPTQVGGQQSMFASRRQAGVADRYQDGDRWISNNGEIGYEKVNGEAKRVKTFKMPTGNYSMDEWRAVQDEIDNFVMKRDATRRTAGGFPFGDGPAKGGEETAPEDKGAGLTLQWTPIEGQEHNESVEATTADGGRVYATLNSEGHYHWGGTDAAGADLGGDDGFSTLAEAQQAAEAAAGGAAPEKPAAPPQATARRR